MKRHKKFLYFLTGIGIIINCISCTCVNEKNAVKENDNFTAIENKNFSNIQYLLPSPGEILERIQGAKIQFQPDFVNSIANKDKYIGSRAQSLNLGIYITDMAYSALSGRASETAKYLETIQSLSSEVGISISVFETLIERAKTNAGIMDSLVNISNEAFANMSEFLEAGSQENTLALISTGAYVECLYLSLKSVSNYSDENPFLTLISEMKYPLDNLYERAQTNPQDENIQTVVNYLDQIILIFNDLDSKSSKTVISKDENGDLLVLGGDSINLNGDDFISLKDKIIEIRSKIISY